MQKIKGDVCVYPLTQKHLQQYNFLLDTLGVAFWEWDIATDAFSLSEQASSFLSSLLISSSISRDDFQNFIHPDDRDMVKILIDAHLDGTLDHYNVEYRLKVDRNYIWIREVGRVSVENDSGFPGRLEGVFQCIDTQKRIEVERERYEKTIRLHNKELEHFAHIAAHDLNAPLANVELACQVIEDVIEGPLPEEMLRWIESIKGSTKRMRDMIRALLQHSRDGVCAYNFERLDLKLVCKDVLTILCAEIESKGAIVHLEELPIVTADRASMMRVLQNLLANALKYCRDKRPEITIGGSTSEDEHIVYVKDNGIGIGEEFFECIFSPFKRLHTHQEFSGSGIGLSSCKTVIERHGGSISVDSSVGTGSTFTIRLPRGCE